MRRIVVYFGFVQLSSNPYFNFFHCVFNAIALFVLRKPASRFCQLSMRGKVEQVSQGDGWM